MKKLILTLVVVGALAVGGFMVLLSQSTPDNAPSDEVIVDVTGQIGN